MREIKVFIVSLLLFSCLSLTGKAESEKNIVVIDPGHGGMYSGTLGYSGASTGYHEKHANLEVSLKLRNELEKRGYEVVMTRETDRHFENENREDLKARMDFANDYVKGKNDKAVFISIHHNATTSPSFRGFETYYFDRDEEIDPEYPPDPMQMIYSPESKKAARAIHSSTLANAPISEGRGMIPMDFFVTRNAQMPSVLVEVGYMSNPTEEKLIKDPSFQQKVATGISNGVDSYFDFYVVYDEKDNILYTSTSKESALNYAGSREKVRVVYRKTNEEIFNNISLRYAVRHSSQSSFKHDFNTEEEAIAFAEEWANTRVIDNEEEIVVWSNYLEPDYQVIHTSKGVIYTGYDRNYAIETAQKTQNTSVSDQKTGYIIWSNYLTKNFEVRHKTKGALTGFYSEEEAIAYSDLWKNTEVFNKSTGSIVHSNLDPSYNYTFTSDKVSAPDRMLTSIEVSKTLYPNGFNSNHSEKTVILATAFQFADALAAGPYAAQLNNAPILLTRPDRISAELKNELKRLKANKVTVVGGTNAVSGPVMTEIKNLGYTVERISGKDRIETNLKLNSKLKNVTESIVVSSTDFPDALGATPVAVNNNSSIVLVNPKRMTEQTASYLQNKDVTIVGGSAAVSPEVEALIKDNIGSDRVERLAGKDRYETLAAVLNHYQSDLHSTTVLVSTGTNFPDALTASSLSKKHAAPLILTRDQLHPSLDEYISAYGKEHVVERVISVGGVVKEAPLNRIIQLTK
ncbi:hypothetical protein E2R51_07955 [Jeotgalibacillus sp. S-D1]|uniref:cell wall-binding repeat-containing protein n=1 Tax=Jeotgalibacillus sp. S-D1 TaxID=2552189 RepID=UPI00105A3386|nr:cell wall-binding repeat-containing protein [Jeotgalibacillus sp. S-D1]TDL32610.1 hypothetical protein E2R51_07955 [Jeotgalibacillus sp. S-D1]